ncbi:hypothetical protein [Nocardia salmonicida]|uniref:hypothetical protein n=1 Tax=Nocardia salmonicida TaxID=53431 RepID=UPI00363DE8F6
MRTELRVYTENDVWTQAPRLQGIELVGRSAGGSGSATVGGGGGAAILTPKRIRAADLPLTVSVIVGAPGSSGGAGGDTSFGDIVVPGGQGGSTGGKGGLLAGMRGGAGGTAGQPGESVSSAPVRLLAGGGGGAGSGSTGGRSGLVPAGGTSPAFWQHGQSGGGGNSGAAGGFPAGGGGAGALGAAGCLTIIEYYWED